MNKILRYAFCISYGLLIFLFIDHLMIQSQFTYYPGYLDLYFIIWFIAIIFTVKKHSPGSVKIRGKAALISIAVAGFYIFFGILSYTTDMTTEVNDELVGFFRFLSAVFLSVFWINKLHTEKAFILISYFVPCIMLVKAFFDYGAPLDVFSHITNVFSNTHRFRLDFGLYHVNALGNLCAMIILLSAMVFVMIHRSKIIKGAYAVISYIAVAALDSVITIVILSSASRNSILSVIIFISLLIYYVVTSSKQLNGKKRGILKLLLIILCLSVASVGLVETFVNLFVDSNRFKNFQINLPVLYNSGRLFIGLGLFHPGLFGNMATTYGRTYYVDNYYLYIILETGILGAVIMFSILFFIGWELHKKIKESSDIFSVIIFIYYIVQLIAGMGETCVIYYIFPSCLIFLIIYLLNIRKDFSKRLE